MTTTIDAAKVNSQAIARRLGNALASERVSHRAAVEIISSVAMIHHPHDSYSLDCRNAFEAAGQRAYTSRSRDMQKKDICIV